MIAPNLTLSSLPAPPISAPSLFSLFATKRAKLTPLFSYSSPLFKKERLPNPFAINPFRTLSQNTGGYILQAKRFLGQALLRHRFVSTISFRIRTYAKGARNPFTMNTSKTKHLKPFRMNTYKKTGEGVPPTANHLFVFSPFNTKLPALFTLLAVSPERSFEGSLVEESTVSLLVSYVYPLR
jgi:hypothetical protein